MKKNMLDLFPSLENVTTGEKIKAYRTNFKLSQAELGQILNISENNLSKIENNRKDVDLKTATKLCAVFNINIEDLLFPQGIEKNEHFIEVRSNMKEN